MLGSLIVNGLLLKNVLIYILGGLIVNGLF
jgi:hypothetical protein